MLCVHVILHAVLLYCAKCVMFVSIQGLVHPKMKILSVFAPSCCFKPLGYVFICSAVHKGRYLEERFNQTDLIPH